MVRERLRLIWIDKIALICLAALLAVFFVFWVVALIGTGVAGANHVLAYMGVETLEYVLTYIGIVWIALRVLDAGAYTLWRKVHAHPVPTPERAPNDHIILGH